MPSAQEGEQDKFFTLPDPSPEMADIYSLGCVFLDIITFLLKGKTTDFVKHRTTRIISPVPNGKRSRLDASFHATRDKVDDWIEMLKVDAERYPEQVYRGVPALLQLIQKMLISQATLRPSALQVRDKIKDILVGTSGIDYLCCANRIWGPMEIDEDAVDTSEAWFEEQERLENESTPESPATEGGAVVSTFEHDDGPPLSRTESNAPSVRNRRRSSAASTATAKISSWRRKFSKAV
jgi:hypothetical protein